MSRSFLSQLPRGIELVEIWYQLLPWEDRALPDAQIDSVSTSVVLKFANTSEVRFRWMVQDGIQRLTTDAWRDGDPVSRTRMEDMSNRWPQVVGARIIGQAISVQQVESGTEPWACRLDFDNATHLVVGLGELTDDGEITYIPDNLIVTNIQAVASAYRPPAAESSAWG